MPNIAVQDARPLFIKKLVDVYSDRPMPTGFLRSLFRTEETGSKNVSIEVERNSEKVAVDVARGTEGRRNTISLSTEKIWTPPYYREYFDATDLDFYDVLFGMSDQGQIDELQFAEWIQVVSRKLVKLQDKIERAIELQCSQVLQTGILNLNNATDIDFKRKPASLVDLGGANYWDQAASDPVADIEAGCNFLRQVGKAQGSEFNMIVGGPVLNALLDNAKFKERADIRHYTLDQISMPERQSDALGHSFHGILSAGSYRIRIWTYPQFYDNAAGVSTPYIDDNKFILVPMDPRFTLAFAAVPKIMKNPGNEVVPEFLKQVRGAFHIGNYVDPRLEKHVFDVKSAPIAIPTAVDTIYTAQALA